jgi:5-oxoprolinase (ATP-hydrolysing) subunit B
MKVTGVRRAGERAVVLDTDDEPAAVAASLRSLAAASGILLVDVVPGAVTVLAVARDAPALTRLIAVLPRLAAEETSGGKPPSALIEIHVRYDGPDLTAVAAATGMRTSDVIRRHSAAIYRAAFTGFAPGFAYLTGLDAGLRLPRRPTPRPAVPPGSVAIADAYTAVYPRASPGGWHLIGTTEAVIFDPGRQAPALLTPGAQVRFRPS